MPNENEIIAVFKADIEQYKAQIKQLSTINNEAVASTDKVIDSTDGFSSSSISASSSIKALSQGLGGITGLLGITGKLFGINTDKIQSLLFSTQQFAAVARSLGNIQKLNNLTNISAAKSAKILDEETVKLASSTLSGANAAVSITKAIKGATAATVVSEGATVSLTVAERILNAVRSAGALGIGLVVAGVVALGAAINNYLGNLKEEERQLKKRLEGVKENIKLNNELTESFNKRAKSEDESELDAAVRAGRITERTKEELLIKSKALQEEEIINNKFREKERLLTDQQLNERSTTFLAAENRFLTIREELASQRNKQIESIESNLDTDLKVLREGFAKEDAEAKKKEYEKSLAEREASLQREFNAFVKYWDDVDKKNRDAQKLILEENKKFEDNKQKLLEDEFTEEQDSAAKNREIGKAATKKRLEEEKEANNKRIDAAKNVADIIFKAQQEAFDKRQELLQKEVDIQETNIETQRRLAENGLTNTLAFEQRRAAELQRQQQLEVQKQKRVKLLETFLNSLAEFSKADPKTAISKALLQVALAQAATAVFAEDGGIIGEIGERSNLRRKHKGGGDVLLHAQTGEGILSRREMDNLGKRNFHLLKDAARFPIRDDVFGMPKLAVMNGGSQVSNENVIRELKTLQAIIKNQPRDTFDINKWGDYTRTTIENGVTEITKGKLPKPRFR